MYTIAKDSLQLVSKKAPGKTHFVIVDAVGATKSEKTDSRPLERKPSGAMKDLLGAVKWALPMRIYFYRLPID